VCIRAGDGVGGTCGVRNGRNQVYISGMFDCFHNIIFLPEYMVPLSSRKRYIHLPAKHSISQVKEAICSCVRRKFLLISVAEILVKVHVHESERYAMGKTKYSLFDLRSL